MTNKVEFCLFKARISDFVEDTLSNVLLCTEIQINAL